jgi:adenylate cyclase
MSETKAPDTAGKPPDRRKLIAVVYMDMAGYSRLIGLDDAGTLERLRILRREVIDLAIEEHFGKIVQTGGDSLLVVFDSIDGAMRCAVKVQEQVPIHDGAQPLDRAIRFRVGINIGDAIADGTDLHGDAVNIAARLQAECPPGGICVTRPVRDHMRDRVNLPFEELGPLNLKNITHPVEAFVAKIDSAIAADLPRGLMQGQTETAPLPDKPSIAVLPFANVSADPEQEYFSDGIADDIITELSRSHSLFVISRNSSFTYRGRSVDVKQIARELGVRYVVAGGVRRAAGRIRINAHLADGVAGNQIWAERYDREIRDVFSVQDEITVAVISAILPTVTDAEKKRILSKQPNSLSAWETYQCGLWHLSTGAQARNVQAQRFFKQATEMDPNFSSAFAGLALTYAREVWFHGAQSYSESARTLAETAAQTAVALDPDDSEAHAALARVLVAGGNLKKALDHAERSLALNRNSASAHVAKAAILVNSGRWAEGRGEALMSLRLNPRDPTSPVAASHIVLSYYFENNYAAAVEAAARCVADYPAHLRPRRFLVAALGQLGQSDEAATALRDYAKDAGSMFDLMVRDRPPYMRPQDHEHMLDGLRKAGWQGLPRSAA